MMFASMFLLELKKLNTFIDGILKITTKESFLLFEGDKFDENGLLLSPYDIAKVPVLIEYFRNNPYYRITASSAFITEKNPFEMFYSEIYIFQNDNLINDLIRLDKILNETNLRLTEYMKRYSLSKGMGGADILLDFLGDITEIQKNVLKVLSDKNLEAIANGRS